MNRFIIILLIIAIGLMAYNATKIDPSNILGKDSAVAVISILASAIVVVLLLILRTVRKIEKKKK